MTLIFNIHYFLWYGALTSIFGYEMVYARQYTNASTVQFGYLNMILPFVTVITTPFICSMADRHRNHRKVFTLALCLATLALCLYGLLPLIVSSPSYDNQLLIRSQANQNSKAGQQQAASLLLWPFAYFCFTSLLCDLSMGVANCLSDSFAVLQAEENGTSFGRIIVWGTFGWAASALALCFINQTTLLPRLLPGIIYGTCLLTLDVIIVSFWPKSSDFKLDLISSTAAGVLTGSTPWAHKDPSDYMPLNETARINLGTQIDNSDGLRHRKMKSPLQLVMEQSSSSRSDRQRASWQILKRISSHHKHKGNRDGLVSSLSLAKARLSPAAKSQLESTTESPSETMSSVVIKTIESNGAAAGTDATSSSGYSHGSAHSTTNSDMSNSLAASSSLVGGALAAAAELNTENNSLTTLVGSNGLPVDAETTNATTQKAPQEANKTSEPSDTESRPRKMFATSFRMQILLLGIILRKRRSLIRFFVLFILAGFFMSMHWNYFFLYLEEIYEPNFEFISAFSMVSQSLIGELPFFILSRKFIDFFGRSHTISISIISIGIRFLLYGFFLPNVNMYLIVVSDCFQGPNYGLFYVVMTEVGLEYSFCDDDTIEKLAVLGHIDSDNRLQVDTIRLSLRSTVQSVAFACYEGLGVGLGSVFGGWIVHSYGFHALWLTMATASISVGIVNIIVELVWKESPAEELGVAGEPEDLTGGHKSIIVVMKGSEVRKRSQNSHHEARRDFLQATRDGSIKRLSTPRSFPAPIPMAPFKFQQPVSVKLQVLMRRAQEAAANPTGSAPPAGGAPDASGPPSGPPPMRAP